MISFNKESIQSFSDIYLDLIGHMCHIINSDLVLRHVLIEGLEILFNVSDLLLKVILLMVELNVVVPFDVLHQRLNHFFILIHLRSDLVFLTYVLASQFVQSFIVNFEKAFHSLLMII